MAALATPAPAAPSSSPVMESSRDMMAMAPTDLFAEVSDTPPAEDGEESSEPETFETPEELPETPTEPDTDEEPEPEEKPIVEDKGKKKDETTPEELPEGVKRGKDRNGKDGLFVEENRWNTIHGNHKLVQQASGIFGEPATIEALQLRNEALIQNDRLFNNLNSADPTAQASVVDYILSEMADAYKTGEVGTDPAVPFAKTLYDTFKTKSPDAYAQVRLSAARDLAEELFHEAAMTGDKALFTSAQHMVRKIAGFGPEASDMNQVRAAAQKMGIPIHSWDEANTLKRGPDPVAALRAENEALKSKVNGGVPQNQAAQFGAWQNETNKAIHSSISEGAIKPALESVAKGWEKFPSDYQRLVVEPLHREVTKIMNSDEGFKGKIESLKAQAKRAVSAQVRASLTEQVKTAYTNRAKQAVDVAKKDILPFAATFLKERSDSTHARRSDAQTRTAPSGKGGTVPKSLIPNNLPKMGDSYSSRDALAQMAALVGNR